MYASAEPAGSLLIRRARLLPVPGAAPSALAAPAAASVDGLVDVLVRDGVVVGVHRRDELTDRHDPPSGAGGGPASPEVVDLDGRWLMPGLWDQHVHLGQWVLRRGRLDLAGITDVDAACTAVRERLAASGGEPVVAWGHRPSAWPQSPTVAALDAVSDTVPIVLISGDGHHGWLNTPALRTLGLPAREGVVAETEWFAAYPLLAQAGLDGDQSAGAYREAMEQLTQLGLVGVVDLEFGAPLAAWGERVAAGVDVLKVRAGVYPEQFDEALRAGLRTGSPLPGCGPRQRFAVLKIISDGSLTTGTAWCCDPYPGEGSPLGSAHHGAANYTRRELDSLVNLAMRSGVEVATHAIGDAAVAQALDVHERWAAPGSIEHAQLIRREDVPRLARLGLRASVQPAHLLDDRDPTERIWPDRAHRCYALRWMQDAGVQIALGSDAPVSPLDPWLAMAAAVHRSADDREPWHAEQSLTVAQALAASVDGQGTVHVGMPADLVALDSSPYLNDGTAAAGPPGDTRAQADHLRGLRSSLTVIDGRVAHTSL